MNNRFSWTQEYRRSWEKTSDTAVNKFNIKLRDYNPNRKNLIRHCLIAIDTSKSIEKQDYVPTVRNIIANSLPNFVKSFNLSNPLSILSFITCKNTFEKHAREFDPSKLLNIVGDKEFSLLNCLKSGVEFLKDNSYSREMLIITASINSKDCGSYDKIISEIKKFNIKVNMISICGEVTLFKNICKISNGIFKVPLNALAFDTILSEFTVPLESQEATTSLVKLGFPLFKNTGGICTCHFQYHKTLYECPICKTLVCSLPSQCRICETQLVTPLSIAKSYYYLYQIKAFETYTEGKCKRCLNPSETRCSDCKSLYCSECSYVVQNDLNFCIFCRGNEATK